MDPDKQVGSHIFRRLFTLLMQAYVPLLSLSICSGKLLPKGVRSRLAPLKLAARKRARLTAREVLSKVLGASNRAMPRPTRFRI
jgi:hypothetical protein